LGSDNFIKDFNEKNVDEVGLRKAITEGLEGEEEIQIKMSAREKSIEENSSVIINDYQKLVEEASFKKKQDNTATAQAYPMVKNLAIEKIKNELKHSSVDKSKGGESSRSLLTENTPSNRSSKEGLFE